MRNLEVKKWTKADQAHIVQRGYLLAKVPNQYRPGEFTVELWRVDEPVEREPFDNDFEAWLACISDAMNGDEYSVKCLMFMQQRNAPDWRAIKAYGMAEHRYRLLKTGP